ncbi:MAG: nitroreductase family deazaflavin-dependent oxidoreductase [Thermomicrobium sp.]|nr:nitroreductase family deazaflavin-dependent oxidoreductase [Thermomicrobium sp.]MDW7981405.1 nitroreductase family deazaflavin-dependent oxidoreductase [Thermomicrobium sp.]
MTERPPTLVRKRPTGLRRLLFRLPVSLYRGPLASLLAWRCVILLTTTGRKTRLPRQVALSAMRLDDRFVVFAGLAGVQADWYRNILVDPEVVVRLGHRCWRATAHVVLDPTQRRALMERMATYSRRCGPPVLTRPLLRLFRLFDYDAEIAFALAHAEELPVVELRPHTVLPRC